MTAILLIFLVCTRNLMGENVREAEAKQRATYATSHFFTQYLPVHRTSIYTLFVINASCAFLFRNHFTFDNFSHFIPVVYVCSNDMMNKINSSIHNDNMI